MKTRYYHTSGTRFKIGQLIGGPGKRVFLTTDPVPHGTIQEIVTAGYGSWAEYSTARAKDMEVYWDQRMAWNQEQVGPKPDYPVTRNPDPVELLVYEIKPYRKPVWVGINDEFRLEGRFGEVVRRVGSARGILGNHYRKFGRDSAKSPLFRSRAVRGKR